jgi:hypothetical protein
VFDYSSNRITHRVRLHFRRIAGTHVPFHNTSRIRRRFMRITGSDLDRATGEADEGPSVLPQYDEGLGIEPPHPREATAFSSTSAHTFGGSCRMNSSA